MWKPVPALEGEEPGWQGCAWAGPSQTSGDGCWTPLSALLVMRWMQVLRDSEPSGKSKKKIPSYQLSVLWMFIQMPYIFSNPHWDKFSQVLQGFLGKRWMQAQAWALQGLVPTANEDFCPVTAWAWRWEIQLCYGRWQKAQWVGPELRNLIYIANDRHDFKQFSSNGNGEFLVLREMEKPPVESLVGGWGKSVQFGDRLLPKHLGSDCITRVCPVVVPRSFAHISMLLHQKNCLITKCWLKSNSHDSKVWQKERNNPRMETRQPSAI